MTQYLAKKDFSEVIKLVNNISSDEILSTSTYNEEELLVKFNNFSEDSKILLAKCAIQIAIIGSGGNSYGQIKHDNETLNLTDIFDNHNIKYFSNENSKFETDEFTPRRLVRLFRYLIQEYIKVKGKSSYLWKKYCGKEEFINSCFPGAEHMIKEEKEANNLIKTYKILDEEQNTNFVSRVKNVFRVRKVKFDDAI
jgi:hypothetical protein